MLCLKCKNHQLIEFSLGSGIYRCGNCSSHWLDYKPVESYLVERNEMTAKAFRTIWDLKSEKSPTLKCPRDHSDLYVFSYKGIELDFCMECKGLWFDVFELEAFSNRDDLEKANFRQAGESASLTAFGVLEAAASLVVGCVGIGLSGGGGPGN
jgi:Zn-finger nucleic acid-binding protein